MTAIAPPFRKAAANDAQTLHFDHGAPVKVIAHTEQQISPAGKRYRLELETPEGPAFFTYNEFVRWAQTVATMLRPSILLEEG